MDAEEDIKDLEDVETPTKVIPFDRFWNWVQDHPNCILRVASPNMVLYDDDDYHWYFGADEENACFVQVLRGKRYVGELVLDPTQVGSVTSEPAGDEEFVFDLLDSERHFICQFVLSHAFEESDPALPARRMSH
ncbi:MAG: hypothetical protein A2289_04995 [Deltaproteobacteria bacterium RIFOXYA12_FULL_58_15]|nr:MAG: hypothetical protein A2289_04995 [Deltaproteobacteria bacterium RIFOXYA12_FULL_58_15]OGR09378.1 MAG: hypothetical protein A2341_17975 [Deltaproteobacteria bacterium RIFOXYB12_FULL_58_9]